MTRTIAALLLLACITGLQAKPTQRSEIAVKLLHCSTLYLAISDVRGEQYQEAQNPNSFLSRGMAYRGMSLALTSPEFISSELEAIGKNIGGLPASETVRSLIDIGPECADLPLAHSQPIAQAFEQLKTRKEKGKTQNGQ